LELQATAWRSQPIGTWTNMGYTVTGTDSTGGLFDQVTNSVPTTETKKFIRLTVEN
jgi:hypothetical protein